MINIFQNANVYFLSSNGEHIDSIDVHGITMAFIFMRIMVDRFTFFIKDDFK